MIYWATSFFSLIGLWFTADQKPIGPLCGLVAQAGWFLIQIDIGEPGLWPAWIIFTLVHMRNLIWFHKISRQVRP